MTHNQDTPVEPINTSLGKFGVWLENNFVVLDDAKHVIGVDANDPRNLMIENVKNAKADKLKSNCSSCKNFISTLVYDKGTASL